MLLTTAMKKKHCNGYVIFKIGPLETEKKVLSQKLSCLAKTQSKMKFWKFSDDSTKSKIAFISNDVGTFSFN